MSIFRWVSEGASLALAVGVFLILYSTLRTLVDTLANLWRRMFASWTTLRLRDLGILREEKSRQRLAVESARQGGRPHAHLLRRPRLPRR